MESSEGRVQDGRRPARPSPQELAKATAWLWCDPLPPVPIGLKPKLVLGRSRDCDFVLPHESVSKTHAMVRALGDEIVLEDQSTYGTTVNGERVRHTKLSVGDVIGIGPYLVVVRKERDKRNYGQSDTKPLRIQSVQSNEAMGGRLEKVSLSEVLQQIEFNKKTGTLKVFDDSDVEHGVLVIYEGMPMYAKLGKHTDDKAVIKMLTLKRGNFSFHHKVEAGEKTMESSLTAILFESSRQFDESGFDWKV